MRNKILSIILILSVFMSCSESDDNQDNQEETGQEIMTKLTATINGEQFEAVQARDTMEGFNNGVPFFVSITGSNENNNRLVITLDSYQGVGQYDMTEASRGFFYRDFETGTTYIFGGSSSNGSGSLTVESDDGESIEGIFSFQTSSSSDPNDVISVTQGRFIAVY